MAEIRKKTAVDDFEVVSASGTAQLGSTLALVGLADVFIKRVGGTGADFAFDDLDGALTAFEASSANECVLLIGAVGVIADGSPVTVTKGPVTFRGTVVGASVAVSGANAITFDLADTDRTPVTFEDCNVSRGAADDNFIFTQSGSLRLINCLVTDTSGGDNGLFRQVAIGGTLKVFARNCTFAAAQDTAVDSPIFLSLATSGTGLELHLDNCVYVRDGIDPTSFLKCTAANVRFVLENHTVLFGPRIKTTTFSIDYDGTSLMADDKNNTGTATVHGEAAYSTRMDAISGVAIEIFEGTAVDAFKFVGSVLHILPGTYTYPATAASSWQNLSDRTIYGDGKSSKIVFSNAFTGNRILITGSGNDNLVIRGLNFELQAVLGSSQTFISISTSDKIRFETCTFGNTASNVGEFCLTFAVSADECAVRDCEFIWASTMEGIEIAQTARSSFYGNKLIGQISIGMRLGSNANFNFIYSNHFERTGGGAGTSSIQLLANTDNNFIVNNYVGIDSSAGGISVDNSADDNVIKGNYGSENQDAEATVRLTDPNSAQANANFIFDSNRMGRIGVVTVGDIAGDEDLTNAIGRGINQIGLLGHQSYGEIFVFIRSSVNWGTVGSTAFRNITFIGVSDDAEIIVQGVDLAVDWLGGGADEITLRFVNIKVGRAGTDSGHFDGATGVKMRLIFEDCVVDNQSSSASSGFFDSLLGMEVIATRSSFRAGNAAGIVFQNQGGAGVYRFKDCTVLASSAGEIINHPLNNIGTLEFTDKSDFLAGIVDLGTGTVTISHDGTTKWDETSLTSGAITRTGHYFSTDEVATGETWIDNSAIFRKVVNTGALPNATTSATAHSITGLDKILFTRGFAENTGGNQIPLPFVDAAAIANGNVALYADDTNVTIDAVGDATAFDESHVELWYTKV